MGVDYQYTTRTVPADHHEPVWLHPPRPNGLQEETDETPVFTGGGREQTLSFSVGAAGDKGQLEGAASSQQQQQQLLLLLLLIVAGLLPNEPNTNYLNILPAQKYRETRTSRATSSGMIGGKLLALATTQDAHTSI